MKLFLISNGDFTTEIDRNIAMQHVVIIGANSVQDQQVQDAIRSVARVKRIDLDEVVVNELGQPIDHQTPVINELCRMDTPDMF